MEMHKDKNVSQSRGYALRHFRGGRQPRRGGKACHGSRPICAASTENLSAENLLFS